jgi:hypothetical protein
LGCHVWLSGYGITIVSVTPRGTMSRFGRTSIQRGTLSS